MDLDPGSDVHMQDGEVLDSTEPNGGVSQSLESSLRKPEASSTSWSRPRDSSVKKSLDPPLKGAGLKREGDIFDYALTKRKDAPRPPKFKALPYATSQTGLVYDVRMRFHVELIATEDDIHPKILVEFTQSTSRSSTLALCGKKAQANPRWTSSWAESMLGRSRKRRSVLCTRRNTGTGSSLWPR